MSDTRNDVGRISCSKNNCPVCPSCFGCPSGGFTDPAGGFTNPTGGFTNPTGGFTDPGDAIVKPQVDQAIVDWEMCAAARRSQQAELESGRCEQLDLGTVLVTLANQLDAIHAQQETDRVVTVRNSDKKLLLQRYIDHLAPALQMTSTTGLSGDVSKSLKTKLFEVEAELATHRAEQTLVCTHITDTLFFFPPSSLRGIRLVRHSLLTLG
jgi:hypothetical protein